MAYSVQAALTWGVNDGQIGAELVLNLDNNLFGPKLLFTFQPCILIFYVVLHIATVRLVLEIEPPSSCALSCAHQVVTHAV